MTILVVNGSCYILYGFSEKVNKESIPSVLICDTLHTFGSTLMMNDSHVI